jgi:protein O-mannosyl-transferase
MSDRSPSRRATLYFAAILGVSIVVAFANSFPSGFHFDDNYGIVNNPSIKSLRNVPQLFLDPHAYWTEHTQPDMRPILMLSYAINYAVSELRPWSYHALNLLIHFCAAFVVFILVRDHIWIERGEPLPKSLIAASVALFFALAPLNNQPVVYIWARSALLCTAFYLAGFLCYLRARPILGGLFQTLALLTKAIAVTLPVLLLAHAFFYRDRDRHPRVIDWLRDWRPLVRLLALPAVLNILYLTYRFTILPSDAHAGRHAEWVTPITWFMTQWSALLYYVRLFVWPDGLSIDHDFPYATSFLQFRAWGSLLVILIWIGVALRLARRYPHVAFATFWFFLTLAPESTFAPLGEVINDHRPYIASSLGLSVLLAWLLVMLVQRVAPRREVRAYALVVIVLCIAAIPVHLRRNWEWSEPLRLWESTVRTSPGNSRAWMNAGQLHMSRGDRTTARVYFERARQLAPGYPFVYMNISALEAAEGNMEASLQAAREAVRLRPQLSMTHVYLGAAYERTGAQQEAVAAYRHALTLNPREEAARSALRRLEDGVTDPEAKRMAEGLYALRSRNDPAAAAEAFRQVLETTPDHYGATFHLALALDEQGRAEEATRYWERTAAMAADFKDSKTRDIALQRLKNPAAAETQREMKAGIEALYQRNDAAAAARHFRRVLTLNPDHYGATYQLAVALDRTGTRAEARRLWERMLPMAEQAGDSETLATVRKRLAESQ